MGEATRLPHRKGLRPLDASELIAAALALEIPVLLLVTGYHLPLEPKDEITLSDEWATTYLELRQAVMGDFVIHQLAEAERLWIERSRAVDQELKKMGDALMKAGLAAAAQDSTERLGKGK